MMEEIKVARMEELAFLLNKLDLAYFCNDEQIVSWEEELEKLQDEYGKVNLDFNFQPTIFEGKSYKVYYLGILENEVLIVFDACDLRRNRLKFLGRKDYKMLMRLIQDYSNAWIEDDYTSMENIRDYIEREFLNI